MDMVELNKMTQRHKLTQAETRLYEPQKLTEQQSLTLVINALKKTYGLHKAVKIIHGLGIKKL